MSDVPIFISADGLSGSERRISLSWTIDQLRHKLEQFTGIPPSQQTLQLFTTATSPTPFTTIRAGTLTGDESGPLGKLPGLMAYSRIVVIDARPPGARENYNDVSQVEKFVMSEGDYEKRNDTVLAWKKRNQLGRFAAADGASNDNTSMAKQEEIELAEIADRGIKVGARCQITEGSRRGTVRYVGKIPEITGSVSQQAQLYWVGVEIDEPLGKNDGSIKGVRYFQALHNHGAFVKPALVEIGDFPSELDDLLDDEDEL
jgi:tubulin-folding cofactor B